MRSDTIRNGKASEVMVGFFELSIFLIVCGGYFEFLLFDLDSIVVEVKESDFSKEGDGE